MSDISRFVYIAEIIRGGIESIPFASSQSEKLDNDCNAFQ